MTRAHPRPLPPLLIILGHRWRPSSAPGQTRFPSNIQTFLLTVIKAITSCIIDSIASAPTHTFQTLPPTAFDGPTLLPFSEMFMVCTDVIKRMTMHKFYRNQLVNVWIPESMEMQ